MMNEEKKEKTAIKFLPWVKKYWIPLAIFAAAWFYFVGGETSFDGHYLSDTAANSDLIMHSADITIEDGHIAGYLTTNFGQTVINLEGYISDGKGSMYFNDERYLLGSVSDGLMVLQMTSPATGTKYNHFLKLQP